MVNWSTKTWVGNSPPCPPISYVPVYLFAMSSFFSHLLCNGVLAPKVDKLVPPQCAASADRFPVKRLTRAPASAAADEAPSFYVSKALLVRRVAYCFDLGRCSSWNKRRKSMAYKLLASPKNQARVVVVVGCPIVAYASTSISFRL